MNENNWSVIKIAQEILSSEVGGSTVTPAAIDVAVSRVLAIVPDKAEGLDRDFVKEELIRRSSVWVGVDASIVNNKGHEPWLTAELKKDWRYWRRYREWQETKLPPTAVEGLDKSTDNILSMLEDPRREGAWDRRGMVVGHVQSGKTGSYTGLICKAADAGYKIIIVLAGLHNNLRAQTQMRLDEGFLGYETSALEGEGNRLIGVGKIDSSPTLRPQYVTNRSETGDFNTKFAKNLGISPEQRPWLFVVKKNKTVLTRLLKWIQTHVAQSKAPDGDRPLVNHLPLLMIDDEADHASVDTGEKVVDENGAPDMEHEPKAINSLVRQILHAFSRKAYVGYTATPFANIYIHEHGETKKEGPDLFPAAFITNISAPSSYVGPSRVFGLAGENGRVGAMNLVRRVDDQCAEDGKQGWMPVRHKSSHSPLIDGQDTMPASLVEAIHSFTLACCARNLRGQGSQHASMLVHVTRFNAVQQHVHRQVETYVHGLKQRLRRHTDCEAVLADMRELWERDFLATSREIEQETNELGERASFSWKAIEELLIDVLEEIDVRMINGKAGDVLDYADSVTGLKVIAIGGDKLARGLTLEGLCTSYFLRASKMYDTLMQMGRWFGYRPGYLDLCRLYTTQDLVEWFEHIADAAEELRAEFDYMADSRLTPRQYGLKVKSHPVLMVTSPLKMRTATTLHLSFSGDIVETVSFYTAEEKLRANLDAFHSLCRRLGDAISIPPQIRNGKKYSWNGVHWTDVGAQDVVEFLRAYQAHPDSRKVRSDLLANFIEEVSYAGELISWTVAVLGGEGESFSVASGAVSLMRRTNKTHGSGEKYSIGRLLSPKDEMLDLDEAGWRAALEMTKKKRVKDPGRSTKTTPPDEPSGLSIRRVKGLGSVGVAPHPEKGLLIISLLDPKASEVPNVQDPVVAFAISFPSSNAGKTVPYVTNSLWERQYGASE